MSQSQQRKTKAKVSNKVRVERVGGHDLPVPRRQTDGAAGYDLCVKNTTVITSGSQALIPTGFAWEIPAGHVGLIRDRSGHALNRRLTTRAGVIDSDYRGEVCVVVVNESGQAQTVNKGQRIAQLIIMPVLETEVVEAEALDGTDRGDGGFGSTGA